MTEATPEPGMEADRQFRILRRCLPLQVRLHETLRSLGDPAALRCLEFGASMGAATQYLRSRGGSWQTVATTEEMAASIRAVVPEGVSVWDGKAFPFERQTFDAVVVLDRLETQPADEALIEECHRVLKPDGRLIVNVWNRKRWMLVTLFRKSLGVAPETQGMVRPGYTESELFQILKHGFDVTNVRTYSRFFVEMTDSFVRVGLKKAEQAGGAEAEKRVARVYTVAGWFYRVAFQMDMLLFFTRGHCLVATAKRRAWRPRNAPVLIDGRSISEAVLSRPAD